jgi:hypothetical protein
MISAAEARQRLMERNQSAQIPDELIKQIEDAIELAIENDYDHCHLTLGSNTFIVDKYLLGLGYQTNIETGSYSFTLTVRW